MIVGTGSDVGKSIINTGLCRIFLEDGYQPAPFKAQNMSLNSYATPEGLEIGRAQAVQAEACGLSCNTDMNPVLLKPTGDMGSQIILNGRVRGNMSAREYFRDTDREALFAEVGAAFRRLAGAYNPIVMEGAGSISELNLRDRDITNMRMAREAGAVAYLVADIDRGGVFASVYGSLELLPGNEKDLIAGIIVNKFRGDPGLFEQGKQMLEDISGKPVVGVLPYFRDIFIEQEDSVVLDRMRDHIVPDCINVAVLRLQHLANFTDFDYLAMAGGVNVFFSTDPGNLRDADVLILPGSKNTIADLRYLKEKGLDRVIRERFSRGRPVYGICGGYQMMGREILDPLHVEGDQERIEGLGLLPVRTSLQADKKTEQCSFTFRNGKTPCFGYEIHMGETVVEGGESLCRIGSEQEGAYLNASCWGTYIHGIFDNAAVVNEVLAPFGFGGRAEENFRDFKIGQYGKLASLMRASLDMDFIYQSLKND